MYSAIEGKEQIAVNGVILGEATQAEMKALFNKSHPYIRHKPKKKKKENENNG